MRKKIFKAEWNDLGEIRFGLDKICSKHLCFYDDLSVEMSVGYSSSGRSEIKSAALTEEQFTKLKSLIKRECILPFKNNAEGMCDGEEWNFILYSECDEEIKCGHIFPHGIGELMSLVNFLREIADSFSFSTYGEKSYTSFFK